MSELASLVHKAAPAPQDEYHCGVCGQHIRRVPGGQGPTYVHSDSGAVAAPNPPGRLDVSIEPAEVTAQSIRALEKYLNTRGPEDLTDALRVILRLVQERRYVHIISE